MINYQTKVEFLSRQARKLDPYLRLVNSKKLFSELQDEILESIEVLEKWEHLELEKEMWDIFWVFSILAQKLEEEWKIDIHKMYQKIYMKMSTRKSFLEEDRCVSEKEAKEIWNAAKKKEWYSDDRLWTDDRVGFE